MSQVLEQSAEAADKGTSPPASDFEWMTGFECSTFPQVGMDELVLTQHDRFWGSDLLRARDAGCRVLRYGIRWHVVSPRPHEFDWSSVDGPMELMRHLGMEPIVDLFHFGVPEWLGTGVLTSIFPDFQAELCREFARRYPWVRWYTPTNEPYIMAQFGGETGAWYPYEQGPQTFVRAMRNVARGVCEGWAEIVRERPDARMMISDTCEYWHPLDDGSRERAELMNDRRFVMHELYGGRVGPDHGLRAFLLDHGMPEADLAWFQENPAPLDIVGLDHYPHSEHQLSTGERGQIIDETRPMDLQHGPGELARQYFERLGRPVLFAETGAPGNDERKLWWLERIVEESRTARENGVPVIGITWWGLIDQVDWGSGLRRFNYEVDPTGLYALRWNGEPRARDSRLERVPTTTLDTWRRYASAPVEETVGRLADPAWPTDPARLW
ncbi:MAG: family 1 glycosylhydrolase [Chloroflexi bacterium]|nr:family 1 glycosylhydrolase [Chloroflexota bacterium]